MFLKMEAACLSSPAILNSWLFLNKFNQFLYTALRHTKSFCCWFPWFEKEFLLLLLHMMFQLRYCNECWQNICTPWSTCGILTLLYLFQFAPQIVHNPLLHIPPCCFDRKCGYVKTEFWKIFDSYTYLHMSQQSDSLVHRILSLSWVYFMQIIWSLLLVVELNQNSSEK